MTHTFLRSNSRKEKELVPTNLVNIDKQMRSQVVGVERVDLKFPGSETQFACFRGDHAIDWLIDKLQFGERKDPRARRKALHVCEEFVRAGNIMSMSEVGAVHSFSDAADAYYSFSDTKMSDKSPQRPAVPPPIATATLQSTPLQEMKQRVKSLLVAPDEECIFVLSIVPSSSKRRQQFGTNSNAGAKSTMSTSSAALSPSIVQHASNLVSASGSLSTTASSTNTSAVSATASTASLSAGQEFLCISKCEQARDYKLTHLKIVNVGPGTSLPLQSTSSPPTPHSVSTSQQQLPSPNGSPSQQGAQSSPRSGQSVNPAASSSIGGSSSSSAAIEYQVIKQCRGSQLKRIESPSKSNKFALTWGDKMYNFETESTSPNQKNLLLFAIISLSEKYFSAAPPGSIDLAHVNGDVSEGGQDPEREELKRALGILHGEYKAVMTEEEEREIKRLLESRNIREVNQLAQEMSQEIGQMETKIIHALISQNAERAMKDAVLYLNLSRGRTELTKKQLLEVKEVIDKEEFRDEVEEIQRKNELWQIYSENLRNLHDVLDNIISRLSIDEATLRCIDNPFFGAIQIDKEKEKDKEKAEKGSEHHAKTKGELKTTILAANRLRQVTEDLFELPIENLVAVQTQRRIYGEKVDDFLTKFSNCLVKYFEVELKNYSAKLKNIGASEVHSLAVIEENHEVLMEYKDIMAWMHAIKQHQLMETGAVSLLGSLTNEIQAQYTKLFDHFYKTIFKLLTKMIDRKVDWKEHIAESSHKPVFDHIVSTGPSLGLLTAAPLSLASNVASGTGSIATGAFGVVSNVASGAGNVVTNIAHQAANITSSAGEGVSKLGTNTIGSASGIIDRSNKSLRVSQNLILPGSEKEKDKDFNMLYPPSRDSSSQTTPSQTPSQQRRKSKETDVSEKPQGPPVRHVAFTQSTIDNSPVPTNPPPQPQQSANVSAGANPNALPQSLEVPQTRERADSRTKITPQKMFEYMLTKILKKVVAEEVFYEAFFQERNDLITPLKAIFSEVLPDLNFIIAKQVDVNPFYAISLWSITVQLESATEQQESSKGKSGIVAMILAETKSSIQQTFYKFVEEQRQNIEKSRVNSSVKQGVLSHSKRLIEAIRYSELFCTQFKDIGLTLTSHYYNTLTKVLLEWIMTEGSKSEQNRTRLLVRVENFHHIYSKLNSLAQTTMPFLSKLAALAKRYYCDSLTDLIADIGVECFSALHPFFLEVDKHFEKAMGKKEKIAEIQYNSGTTNQKLLSTIEKVSLEKIAAELKQQYKKLHKQMGPDSEENLSGEVWDNLKKHMVDLYQKWELLTAECYKGKKLSFTSDELSRKFDAMKYEALVDMAQISEHS